MWKTIDWRTTAVAAGLVGAACSLFLGLGGDLRGDDPPVVKKKSPNAPAPANKSVRDLDPFRSPQTDANQPFRAPQPPATPKAPGFPKAQQPAGQNPFGFNAPKAPRQPPAKPRGQPSRRGATVRGAGGFGGGGLGGFGGGGFGGGGFGGGGLGGGGLARNASAQRKPSGPYQALERLVTSIVRPESWDGVGGSGTLEVVDGWGLMFVSQTEDVHQRVEGLLQSIRRARQVAGEQPGRGDVILIGSDKEIVARKRIEAALEEQTELSYTETPLNDFVKALVKKHKFPIVIDRRALDDVGIGADTPITVSLKGVTLRSALRLVLKNLDLTYVIQDQTLQITTAETAESQLVTKIYVVRDLGIESAPLKSKAKSTSQAPSKSPSKAPLKTPRK